MKTRIALMSLIALAISAGRVPAYADDKADIKALYVRISTAMKNRDIKGIMATGTADFKTKEKGQVMDAKTSEQILSTWFKSMKAVEKMEMVPTKITVTGKEATVLSNFTMKATAIDEKDKKKTHKIVGSGTMKDTLVKGADGWKFKVAETLTNKTLMDGKPMADMAMPESATSSSGGKKK